MDIAKLRKQTAAACAAVAASRAATSAALDAEFNNSPLKEYIDRRIQEAANKGKSELSLNFFDIKERALGNRYGGPTLGAAIYHYSNEGFLVYSKSWLSPNGYGNTSLIISWM